MFVHINDGMANGWVSVHEMPHTKSKVKTKTLTFTRTHQFHSKTTYI